MAHVNYRRLDGKGISRWTERENNRKVVKQTRGNVVVRREAIAKAIDESKGQ